LPIYEFKVLDEGLLVPLRLSQLELTKAVVEVSFAKTGAALLSVTTANVSGVDRTNDRDAWQAWRAFGGTSAVF
jgi:hypothetical protein